MSTTSLRRCVAKYCYIYCLCCLLFSLVIMSTNARLTDKSDDSRKSHNKNEVVEGSGQFGGTSQRDEDPDWQTASGLSPDDEPGDDNDDEDEDMRDGSGNTIEGSGYPRQFEAEQKSFTPSSIQSTSIMQTTTRQAEGQFVFDTPTSTRAQPVDLAPTPVLQYTTMKTVSQTTAVIPPKTTRAPAIVVNTRPQIVDPFISEMEQPFEMLRPGILAAVSGGAVVGILMTILFIMFIVYRMRKKDEGSYSLDEPHHPPNYSYAYQKASTKEFYA